MKINLRSLCLFSLLGIVSVTSASYAQTTTPATSTAEKTVFPTSTELGSGTITTLKRPVRTTALDTQSQTRIQNLAANIANRVDAANTRLILIADRLERRIEKSAAAGYDTNESAKVLQSSRQLLQSTTEAAAQLDQLIFTTVTSENPRQGWQETKRTITVLKQNLQEARDQLQLSADILQTELNQTTNTTSSQATDPPQ